MKRIEIAGNESGLMEGACEVFACAQINAYFAANRAIHLCQERCRNLNIFYSPQKRRCCKACKISRNAAPKCDYEV